MGKSDKINNILPLVSIVIPTFNRQDLVGRAIKSVLNQTYQNFEIVVVDDASTDNTEELVKNIKDSRIKYIRHEKTKFAPASRNTGIKNSRGKYIAFLDSDDEWLPTKIEKQVEKFESSSSKVGIVYCGIMFISNGNVIKKLKPIHKGNLHEKELYRDCLIGGNSAMMVRKECLDKIGGYDDHIPGRGDYDLTLRLSKYYEFEYVVDYLVKISRDSDNRLSNDYYNWITSHQMIINKIVEEIKNRPKYEQNKILSIQYFDLGSFLFYSKERKIARQYLIKALKLSPSRVLFLWNFWRIVFISLIGYELYMSISQPFVYLKK